MAHHLAKEICGKILDFSLFSICSIFWKTCENKLLTIKALCQNQAASNDHQLKPHL